MLVFRLRLAALALLAACGTSNPTDPRRRAAPAPTAYPPGTTLPPGASHVERVNRYDVAGATALDLWREIREKGPMIGARRYAGRTDWNVRWTYGSEQRMGWCRPRDVRVAATVTMILPSWTPADTSSALAREWATYLEALEKHERGHRDLAVEEVRAVRRAIGDAQAPRCAALGPEINRRANAVLARLRERNDAYDRDTEHGARQGARWPPRRLPDTPVAPPPPPPR